MCILPVYMFINWRLLDSFRKYKMLIFVRVSEERLYSLHSCSEQLLRTLQFYPTSNIKMKMKVNRLNRQIQI